MRKTKGLVQTALIMAFVSAFAMLALVQTSNAQRRDYLTEAEIELVRDAQQIDLRVAVLTTAVERRFAAMSGAKDPIKDESKWGAAPSGSKLALLRDIEGLIRKAIDDIDDVASRNADSEFFPVAVRKFAASCETMIPRFKAIAATTKDDLEQSSLSKSAAMCSDVIEAAAKLPKPSKPDPNKKP